VSLLGQDVESRATLDEVTDRAAAALKSAGADLIAEIDAVAKKRMEDVADQLTLLLQGAEKLQQSIVADFAKAAAAQWKIIASDIEDFEVVISVRKKK
jgi:hypothetical protein